MVLLTVCINARIQETENCPLKSGSADWDVGTSLVNRCVVFRHSCFHKRSSLCLRDNKNSGFIMVRTSKSMSGFINKRILKQESKLSIKGSKVGELLLYWPNKRGEHV